MSDGRDGQNGQDGRKEKFFPGPWHYLPYGQLVEDDNLYPIAEDVLDPENGALIAAAPEMYDMLSLLLEFVEDGGIGGERAELYAPAIRDLLKKARGEQ